MNSGELLSIQQRYQVVGGEVRSEDWYYEITCRIRHLGSSYVGGLRAELEELLGIVVEVITSQDLGADIFTQEDRQSAIVDWRTIRSKV